MILRARRSVWFAVPITGNTMESKETEIVTQPVVPDDRYDLRVLRAIRRIIRAADLHSRRLAGQHGVTVPQLLCLTKVVESDGITVKEIAEEIFLSASTVVGILDRLEERGWVERERSRTDKRLVHVRPTPPGEALVSQSPSPLHEELVSGLKSLPSGQQQAIAEAVERLVEVLELERVDASPILDTSVLITDQ